MLAILIISFWALRSLFGGPYYTSHDGIHQVARFYHFKAALKDGVFPPRWANQAFYGYGYPLFNFNYQLPWYVAMIPTAFKLDIFDSIKFDHAAAYIFSGIFMFLFLKELVRSKMAALAGTLLFLVSPYRFLNIYVRNSLGEVFAYTFLPLTFFSLLRLSKNQRSLAWIFFGLSLYGILLSHAMSFIFFAPSIAVFFLVCFFRTKDKKQFFFKTMLGSVLFLGLAAYYLFPAYLEKKYTVFDKVFGIIYQLEALDFKRIIYSPWGYGGNGNIEGVMSFQFGIFNWLITSAGLILGGVGILRKKGENRAFLMLAVVMVAICLFLPTKNSLFFWREFSKIMLIDFPWKYIGVAVFWSSIIFAVVAANLKFKGANLLLGLSFIFIIYSNRNHIRVNEYTSFDIPSAVFAEKGTNTEDEYLPIWQYDKLVGDYYHLEENIRPKNRIEVVPSTPEKYLVGKPQDKNELYTYTYEGPAASHLVKKFYFPGWTVNVNGKPVTFEYAENGFFNFKVPAGNSKIEIRYVHTDCANMSNLVSLLSWGLLLGLAGYKLFWRIRAARNLPSDRI